MEVTLTVTVTADEAEVTKLWLRAGGQGFPSWPAKEQIRCHLADALSHVAIVVPGSVTVINGGKA